MRSETKGITHKIGDNGAAVDLVDGKVDKVWLVFWEPAITDKSSVAMENIQQLRDLNKAITDLLIEIDGLGKELKEAIADETQS